MTFDTLTSTVFRRLREVAEAPVAWTTVQVQAAINRGYQEISDQTEWYERHETVAVLADRPWYDARFVLGPRFLCLGDAYNPDSNRWLIPTTTRQLDAYDRRWEVSTDYAQRIIGAGLWWFSYWPRIQSDNTTTMEQYFKALPPPLAVDNDEPGFPETFQDGLVEYACADLWAQDGETQHALLAWKRYLEHETGLAQWVQGRGGDPKRRGYGVIAGVPA